ncbi:hypothetical protein PMAYCL1PPCAC_13112, partial [Pristionchus mayeri]
EEEDITFGHRFFRPPPPSYRPELVLHPTTSRFLSANDRAIISNGRMKEEGSKKRPMISGRCRWRGCLCTFASETGIGAHVYREHIAPLKEFRCEWVMCTREQPFTTQQELIEHILVHIGMKTHRCTFVGCNESFYHAATLNTHMRTHTGELPFECKHPNCGRAFITASERIKHMSSVHSDGKRYRCHVDECRNEFPDPSSLRSHIKEIHGEAEWERKKILIQKLYNQRMNEKRKELSEKAEIIVERRVKEEELGNDRVMIKEEDPEGTQEELRALRYKEIEEEFRRRIRIGRSRGRPRKGGNHPAVHGNSTSPANDESEDEDEDGSEKNWECCWRECKMSFTSDFKLMEHAYSDHITPLEVDYPCEWEGCTRKEPYKFQYMLTNHVRTHIGMRTHTCPFDGCAKAYFRRENLTTHERTHTGELPYECKHPNCGKAFVNASDRAKHTNRVHSGNKPYNCNVINCRKKYTDPSSLRKHIKNIHGEEVWELTKRNKHQKYTIVNGKRKQLLRPLIAIKDESFAMDESDLPREESMESEESLPLFEDGGDSSDIKKEEEMEFEEFAHCSKWIQENEKSEVKKEVKEEPIDDPPREIKQEEIDDY